MNNFNIELYLKFISYVPSFWHLNTILNKKIKKLNYEELNYLTLYLQDQKLINEFLTNPTPEVFSKVNIDNIANQKLTNFQKEIVFHKMRILNDADISIIEKDTDRDNFMTASQALEYGLIDKILTKKNTN